MQHILDTVDHFQLSYLQWFITFLGAFLLGFSKAGIKGVGVIIVLLMAFVFGGKASTGVLIPIMIVADVFAVIYYNRHTQWNLLLKLLPSMVVGVLIGVWFGNDISEEIFKQIMAVFILITVIIMIYMEHKKDKTVPTNKFFSNGMGLLSGITSMIGNLAGAFASIYFLAMRLPKNEFIGTAAWLFFIINVFKLPFHIFVWKTVTSESILLDLFLVPGVIVGFFVGVQLVKLIHNELYRKFILAVTAAGAVIILLS